MPRRVQSALRSARTSFAELVGLRRDSPWKSRAWAFSEAESSPRPAIAPTLELGRGSTIDYVAVERCAAWGVSCSRCSGLVDEFKFI